MHSWLKHLMPLVALFWQISEMYVSGRKNAAYTMPDHVLTAGDRLCPYDPTLVRQPEKKPEGPRFTKHSRLRIPMWISVLQ